MVTGTGQPCKSYSAGMYPRSGWMSSRAAIRRHPQNIRHLPAFVV